MRWRDDKGSEIVLNQIWYYLIWGGEGVGEWVQNQSSSEWPEIRFGFGIFEIDQICKWSHSNVNTRLNTIVTT